MDDKFDTRVLRVVEYSLYALAYDIVVDPDKPGIGDRVEKNFPIVVGVHVDTGKIKIRVDIEVPCFIRCECPVLFFRFVFQISDKPFLVFESFFCLVAHSHRLAVLDNRPVREIVVD